MCASRSDTDTRPSTGGARSGSSPAHLEPLLDGRPQPAPQWFSSALADSPDRSLVDVDGTPIETLSWGRRGNPGLLLLHGKAAHADWWSFIAPFFSRDYHVVALSWSGMGGSGWREQYPIDVHVKEMVEVAEAAGLFASPVRPVVVAHSFGSYPAIRHARLSGERLRATVIIDPPAFSPATQEARRKRPPKPYMSEHRRYASLEEALRRFRFAPEQPCANLFIADFIARHSLKETQEAGTRRWTWRFDRKHWRFGDFQPIMGEIPRSSCPLAFIHGARSTLRNDGDNAYMRALYPDGTCEIMIEDAAHHVMVDQPLKLVDAIHAILRDLPRR